MTRDFAAGNYRFIPAVFQYSSGAAALPGNEIERVRFDKWLPLAQGFAQAAKYIQAAGRLLENHRQTIAAQDLFEHDLRE
jgi:hypothetical protein